MIYEKRNQMSLLTHGVSLCVAQSPGRMIYAFEGRQETSGTKIPLARVVEVKGLPRVLKESDWIGATEASTVVPKKSAADIPGPK